MPFLGSDEPKELVAEDLKDIEEQADIDGPLVDYKTKGNIIEFVGKEAVEGKEAYHLKLTLKNGNIRSYIYRYQNKSGNKNLLYTKTPGSGV